MRSSKTSRGEDTLALDIDLIPIPVIVYDDRTQRLIQWNSAAEDIFGFRGKEVFLTDLRTDFDHSKQNDHEGCYRIKNGEVKTFQVARQQHQAKDRQYSIEFLIESQATSSTNKSLETLDVRRQLEESERELGAILDASTSAIGFISSDGTLKRFNKSARQLYFDFLGVQPVLGADVLTLIKGRNLTSILDSINAALLGNPTTLETTLLLLDRGKRFIHLSFLPVLNSESIVIGVSVTASDLTESRRAEQENKKANEEMQLAAKIAHIGQWEFDLLEKKIKWSDEVCHIHDVECGYVPSLDESIGFYTEEFAPVISEAINQCVEHARWFDLKLQVVTRKEKIKWVRIVGMAEQLYGQTIRLYGLIQDISETKQKEVELSRLALIAKEINNVIVITGADRKIQWVNAAFTRMTGYTLDEVIGKSPGEILRGHDTDQKTATRIREALDNNQYIRTEILNYTKSGEPYWIDNQIQPVLNANKELDYWIAIQENITKRKADEQRLRQSESMLQEIARNIPGVIFRFHVGNNGHTHFSYISARIKDIFGITLQPKWDWIIAKKIAPKFRQSFLDSIQESIRQKRDWDFTGQILSDSGELKWFHGKSTPIQVGEELVFVGFLIDITKEKGVELLLEESTGRLQLATEAAHLGIWEWDLTTNNILWDSICNDIYHSDHLAPELVHNYWRKGIHQEDVSFVNKVMQQGLVKNEPFEISYRWVTAANDVLELETYAYVKRDKEGRAISLTGLTADVTNRRRAERQLIESEKRFKVMADSAPVMIWMTNAANDLVYCNHGWLDFTGRRIYEELGAGWMTSIHPDDVNAYLATSAAEFQKRNPCMIEYRLRRGDGSYRWILSHSKPRFLDNGEFVGYIGSSFDIDDQKRAIAALVESNREKDLLIKEIHHRIKNNLQLISSIMFLNISSTPESEARTHMENMRQRIKTVSLIHERLLQVGTINEVVISHYLNNLIDDLRMMQPDGKVTFVTDFEDVMLGLDYAINCGLIINELVVNAFKHAAFDDGIGEISIQFRKTNDVYTMSVGDNGKPRAGEQIQQNGSRGFGMKLIEILAKQLKAKMFIENENGTRFKFIFEIIKAA